MNINPKNWFKKETKKLTEDNFSVINVNMYQSPEAPKLIENNKSEWVLYGIDNLYPDNLLEMVKKSATQNSIVIQKAKMQAGSSLLFSKKGENLSTSKDASKQVYDTMTDDIKLLIDFTLNNKYGEIPLIELNKKISLDWQYFGAYALEIIWSMDFKKIAAIKYIPVKNLRSGKFVDDKIRTYYYSRDWSKYKKDGYEPIKMDAFDATVQMIEGDEADKNKGRSYNQILYVGQGNLEYYGEPTYVSAMTWVTIDAELADFYLSTIQNGFNPSVGISIYGAEATTQEERNIIVEGIKKQYTGSKKGGKVMVFFSQDKDSATDIKTYDVSNIDRQYMELKKQTTSQILTGNQVTSPLLFGISTGGQLGANSELEIAYKIFNNSVIGYDRQAIEKTYNMILEINGITDYVVSIEAFNPLADEIAAKQSNAVLDSLNSLSPLVANKVLESMTPDEIRGLVGLEKSIVTTPPAV